ncbi:MAG: hypothetical protein QOF85_1780 [Solirubrobacterales bacterium]|jgi:hypothetical protein|nr:hypothetical protein [Solirubrobacterales bacterium]
MAWIGASLVVLAFLAFFACRPTAILGVDGGALQASVGSSLSSGACRHLHNDAWACSRHDSQFSGDVSYRVDVHGLGCWSATRIENASEPSPRHLSGCITIVDYIFSS